MSNRALRIRYAASPTGQFRWTPPREPVFNNTAILPARMNPPQCSQAGKSPYPYNAVGEEDCLFLNVYSPPDARNLPVMVWLHGGGYGEGNAAEFPVPLLSFQKSFVGVGIQYRLGAFGFLASAEVRANGSLNAGLLDQNFALQWVQKYIHLFGGNPENVTLAGQSAGAGAVMLHAIAYDGSLGSSVFTNLIAASPYLPKQYNYSDALPTQFFDQFATEANCAGQDPRSVLDCLRLADMQTLQRANSVVSASGPYGTWTFVPVTDGHFLTGQPSQQLTLRKINGARILTSNMADEGALFVPQNITTEDALNDFLAVLYPLPINTQTLLKPYPLSAANNTPPDLYATDGTSTSIEASALLASSFATGYQQILNNVYAEMTFVCPSYWLAEAFSPPSAYQLSNPQGTVGFKYQYSIPAAPHNFDLIPLNFGPGGNPGGGVGPDVSKAFLTVWTNFITTGDPSIPSHVLVGSHQHAKQEEKWWQWPEWNSAEGTVSSKTRAMVNWNQTGGEEYETYYLPLADGKLVTQYQGKGLRNAISVVDASNWEMGRGERCEVLRQLNFDS